jgi:hypothetical protein
MKNYFVQLSYTLIFTLLASNICFSQKPGPKPTPKPTQKPGIKAKAEPVNPPLELFTQNTPIPRDSVTQEIEGKVKTTVVYSSPSIKDSTVWGTKVAYGKVWGGGTAEPTRIIFGDTVFVDEKKMEKKLPPGDYALYVIPTDWQWTVIFNKMPRSSGKNIYDKNLDAAVLKIVADGSVVNEERMDFHITWDDINFRWADRVISIPVRAAQ